MHFTDSSTLSDPVRVASLALSLLQAHAYQSLLVISSSSIQDRYILTFDTHTDPLSLFQWQTDSARELLWKWDAHGSLFNDSNMYYRVLDAETTQCCIPFARNGESTGLVVLLKTAADTWTFHNLLETAMDLPTYFQDWSLSLEEAEKTGPKVRPVLGPKVKLLEEHRWPLHCKPPFFAEHCFACANRGKTVLGPI